LTRIREQLGVPPVEVPHKEHSEDGHEPTEAAERPRPRHCAVCKAEMDYVGGTHRPSARRVMDLLWNDIVRAVDVHPESCPVRTVAELCWERAQADLAAGNASSDNDAANTQDKNPRSADPANQRRGPPPDPQGRLAFAVL